MANDRQAVNRAFIIADYPGRKTANIPGLQYVTDLSDLLRSAVDFSGF
jgi:hypothetical protein